MKGTTYLLSLLGTSMCQLQDSKNKSSEQEKQFKWAHLLSFIFCSSISSSFLLWWRACWYWRRWPQDFFPWSTLHSLWLV
jgi:hypothetical protein